jgi:spectinomycin phosphotransferase
MGAGTNEGRRSGAGAPRDALTGVGADVSTPAGVARLLREQYDLDLTALERFEGGWDSAATMWTGVDAGGARYALKITSRDVQFGLSLAGSTGLATAGGVLQPVPTRDGALWATAAGHLITVSHWVDGADAVDLGPDHVDWHELGRVLRAVHDQPVPEGVRPQRRGIRRSPSSPRALIDTVDRAFRHGVAPDLTRRWDAAHPRLRHLAAVARQLKRTRRPTTRVTAHGDPHLGNVLLDDGGRPWLIDFDEATIAPREVDLMLVELGVMFDAPLTEKHRELFRDGYGRDIDIDRERVIRFGCVRAIEDATSSFLAALDGDPADPAPFRMLDGILGPHGLVTLVEKELERLPHSPALADTKEEP